MLAALSPERFQRPAASTVARADATAAYLPNRLAVDRDYLNQRINRLMEHAFLLHGQPWGLVDS